MTTEVYINGNIIDLDEEETVTATYGNISFGDFKKRKGVKTNTWKAPVTSPRNKLVFEASDQVNSFSDVPYRKGSIRVDIAGVPVFEGWCVLEQADDFYEIQSYAGSSDFYSTISTRKLIELDLSAWDHVWNEPNIKSSWTRTEGYIYPFVDYGRGEPFYLEGHPPEFFLPQVFFSTVIKQIATDAGYTLEGKVLSDPRFNTHLVIANKFPLPIRYGETWDLSTVLPDLAQSKMWLDFANIYGQQFDIDDTLKVIRASYIDDLLFNDPEDWSSKVDRTEKTKTNYHWDYWQTSLLRYKLDESPPELPINQDYAKEIAIDDTTLPETGTIYQSEFAMIQDNDTETNPGYSYAARTFLLKPGKAYGGIWNASRTYTVVTGDGGGVFWNGTYYQAVVTSTGEEPPNATYWKPIKETDIFAIKSRAMYGRLEADPSPERYIAFETVIPVPRKVTAFQMDWSYSYQHHYRVFDRIIQKSKLVEMLIKLNYADVNQLDFTRLKRIDGELYYLEEVTQFRLNRVESTICKFVRI